MSETSGALFRRHIMAGTRPGLATGQSAPRWARDEFLRQLKAKHIDHRDYGTKAFERWEKGGGAHGNTVKAMAEVFFGDDTGLADQKRHFLSIWSDDVPPDGSGSPLPAPSKRRTLTNRALLVLGVDVPSQHRTPGQFGLLEDAKHGAERVEGMPVNAVIGLSTVYVRYDPVACQTVGKILGDAAKLPPEVKIPADVFPFLAKPGEMLAGRHDIEVLAVFEHLPEDGPPSVNLTAEGHTDDLIVHIDGKVSDDKRKATGVIGQYLKRKCYPRKGTIPLGTASVAFRDSP